MSEAHASRSADASGFSDIHINPSFVMMPLDPICPTLLSVSGAGVGGLMAMRRVTTLVVECVIVACVSDLFQAPGSHGSAVSRAGMSSCTNRPTTVFWLISPSVMWLDSSFEKLAHSFLKAFLSRSSSCQRLLKICLLVVSSRNCFLLTRSDSTARFHGPFFTAASISSRERSSSVLRSIM